ncbi:MAG: fasciclin domain-containing protein, partial [Mariniphaga sp.]
MKHFRLLLIATMVLTAMGFSATANKVVDIIAGSENHTILETAIVESNLEDDLRGAGPFTIFAPTDAAFQALPEGTIEALLADSRGALTEILLYHTLPGKVMSSDLSDNLTVETYNGKKIQVKINGSGVYINNAMVTVVDLEAENGMVHVIDAVLLPSPDVQLRETGEYGNILTDTYGNSLYFFTRDAAGSSNCVGGCLNNWPVFYSENPELGEGLDASDFGVIDRGDGTMQTTYKGWPLYYFVNDTLPSEINGEGVIGKWFVAKPDYTIMIVDNQLTGNDGVNYKGDYTPGDEVIQYFTDAEGLTLYTWKNDNYNINNFTDEAFAKNSIWPIYEQENVVLPSILDPADFKVINVFGRSQLTFKGWPLYYFGQDNMERGSNKGVSVPSPGVWPVPVQDMMEAPKIPTVVDIVVNSEDHTTLEAAVVAAGLVETLQGDGPFTVFAPTDAAFAALPEGTVEALLADIPALTDILTYHVVGGKAMSSDLSDGQKVIT